MQTADRLEKLPPYLFMTLRNKINDAKAQGLDVISLAIGDPVDPSPPSVVQALCDAAHDPANHPINEAVKIGQHRSIRGGIGAKRVSLGKGREHRRKQGCRYGDNRHRLTFTVLVIG